MRNIYMVVFLKTSWTKQLKLEMWVNAQRDGRPAEYRWRPLLSVAVWLTPTTRVPCSNAAKTWNPLKLPGDPQTNETVSSASGPKFTILRGHVEEILLLNKFFFRLSIHSLFAKISPDEVVRWCQMAIFASCISIEPRTAHFRPAF